MLAGATLDAASRHEVAISPVRVNLVAGVLSWWLPADYNPVLRSSWLSPAEHDAGEKWTMSRSPSPAPPCTGSSQFLLERQRHVQDDVSMGLLVESYNLIIPSLGPLLLSKMIHLQGLRRGRRVRDEKGVQMGR